MTYKVKVFTKELYDIESEEFQKIALEAQKMGTRFGLYTSNQNNGIKCNVKEEIKLKNFGWITFKPVEAFILKVNMLPDSHALFLIDLFAIFDMAFL